MYRPPTALLCKGGAATTCGLAFTGLNVAAYIVGAATLIVLGVVLLHLIPKREA
jgi:hypothetical protein